LCSTRVSNFQCISYLCYIICLEDLEERLLSFSVNLSLSLLQLHPSRDILVVNLYMMLSKTNDIIPILEPSLILISSRLVFAYISSDLSTNRKM
jgi:hypothetical protein